MRIDHDIAAQVTQPGDIEAAAHQAEQGWPARNANPFEGHVTVRMMGHGAVALHRADTPSAANVETDADRALVQVGPAI